MTRKHDSFEYREQIVALVQLGRSIGSVATEFCLANQSVPNWPKEVQNGPLGATERERIIRRELARVKEERDI